MPIDATWESELAEYLTELSATQDELLGVLKRKLALLAAADAPGLAALSPIEQALGDRLRTCYDRRCEMLTRAQRQGLPAGNLRSLAEVLPGNQRRRLQTEVEAAGDKSRLLQHQSLTNWVVTQRTLLHLSHLLEIIATGGRKRPTYGKDEPNATGGSLLDEAA